MYGGDEVYEHNGVRDVVFDYCERGQLRPDRETPGLLADDSDPGCEDRPADVLVLPHLTFARALPDGSRAIRTEPVCLDFAGINALGTGHWSETSGGSSRAAEAYEESHKRRHRRTEERCAEAGLRFWPVVLEHQGGMTKSADSAFRAVAAAVAMQEGRDANNIKQEMLERIAVVIARSAAQRIRRRAIRFPTGRPDWATAARSVQNLQTDADAMDGWQ